MPLPQPTYQNENPFYGTNTTFADPRADTIYNHDRTTFGYGRTKGGGGSIASGFQAYEGSTGRTGGGTRKVGPRPTAPEFPDMPKAEFSPLVMPKRDERREAALEEKAAGTGIADLRRGLNRGMVASKSEQNPYARKEIARQLLAGFGQGLAGVRTAADRMGRSQYNEEFRVQEREAVGNFEGKNRFALANVASERANLLGKYNADMNQYNTDLQYRYST